MSKRDDNLIYEKYKIINETDADKSLSKMTRNTVYTADDGKQYLVTHTSDDLRAMPAGHMVKVGAVDKDARSLAGSHFIGQALTGSTDSIAHDINNVDTVQTYGSSSGGGPADSKLADDEVEYNRLGSFLGNKEIDPKTGLPKKSGKYVGYARKAAAAVTDRLAKGFSTGTRDNWIGPAAAKWATTGVRKKGSGTNDAATGSGT